MAVAVAVAAAVTRANNSDFSPVKEYGCMVKFGG
jgi:hypothetical protein